MAELDLERGYLSSFPGWCPALGSSFSSGLSQKEMARDVGKGEGEREVKERERDHQAVYC